MAYNDTQEDPLITINIRQSVKDKLDTIKPFASISYSDIIDHIAVKELNRMKKK